jgi:hypothetical protein
VLDLSTGIRIYVGNGLHDRDRKIYNYTPFFRLDGALSVDGFAGKTIESISIKSTI